MSLKAARGTKRVCQNCGSKFYDLNRSPATCPMCQSVFQQDTRHKPIVGNAHDDEDDEIISRPAGVELVSLDEVAAAEGEIPDLEDAELVDLDEGADLKDDADETFIEVEDDEGDDVSGLLAGSREDEEEI
jgi:uncharacterized protein (TIGR02300 family)